MQMQAIESTHTHTIFSHQLNLICRLESQLNLKRTCFLPAFVINSFEKCALQLMHTMLLILFVWITTTKKNPPFYANLQNRWSNSSRQPDFSRITKLHSTIGLNNNNPQNSYVDAAIWIRGKNTRDNQCFQQNRNGPCLRMSYSTPERRLMLVPSLEFHASECVQHVFLLPPSGSLFSFRLCVNWEWRAREGECSHTTALPVEYNRRNHSCALHGKAKSVFSSVWFQ